MTRFLLDTNILVHAVRGDAFWTRLQLRYNLLATEPIPLISVVTAGELRSLAYQRKWATSKRSQMEFVLGYFQTVTIFDPWIIEAYALIDSHFQIQGHNLGKNDLWIAATANAFDATLLTTDKDFDPISPRFIARDWINPDAPTNPQVN